MDSHGPVQGAEPKGSIALNVCDADPFGSNLQNVCAMPVRPAAAFWPADRMDTAHTISKSVVMRDTDAVCLDPIRSNTPAAIDALRITPYGLTHVTVSKPVGCAVRT
jgi:hypothetical protein